MNKIFDKGGNMLNRFIVPVVILLCFVNIVTGQTLKEQINNMFAEVLNLETSPGEHGEHFLPVNVASSKAIINSLNNFIGASVSSFPLSSSTAGVTFDFSSGKPVPTSTSFGPIFSERGQTIGQGRINMGLNFTYIKFNKVRGLSTQDLRLTFTHEDVGEPGLGDSPNEFDTMDFYMNMDIAASVFAMYFTYGVTDRFDISIAVPFINVNIKSDPIAEMNSFTWVSNDSANHFFGGTQTEPVLDKSPTPINDDATGIGDIALRAKYNLVRDKAVDFSAMLEYRMANGDADNFLGSGFSSLRSVIIGSKILGDFAPHLNLAYWKKFTDLDRDEFEFIVGFDQKVTEWFTLVIDVLGRIDLGDPVESQQFPESVDINWTVGNTNYTNSVSLTNIPNYSKDNIFDAAFGFKMNLKNSLLIIANVFVPLNDAGLRAGIVPTIGMEFSF
jgi:hypothetical protein